MANTNLTIQRQVFVEEYVRSGDHLEAAKKGGSVLKTGIFGNCVFATFSKNIKHLTYAGCQSEIPLNSS